MQDLERKTKNKYTKDRWEDRKFRKHWIEMIALARQKLDKYNL